MSAPESEDIILARFLAVKDKYSFHIKPFVQFLPDNRLLLVPLEEEKPRSLYDFFAGHVVEEGDIVSPTGEAWEAERGFTSFCCSPGIG